MYSKTMHRLRYLPIHLQTRPKFEAKEYFKETLPAKKELIMQFVKLDITCVDFELALSKYHEDRNVEPEYEIWRKSILDTMNSSEGISDRFFLFVTKELFLYLTIS